MGFIEDLTIYVWNWVVWMMASRAGSVCWMAGGWGLLFDDDDGALMNMCFALWTGMSVTYPVSYTSAYAEAS